MPMAVVQYSVIGDWNRLLQGLILGYPQFT